MLQHRIITGPSTERKVGTLIIIIIVMTTADSKGYQDHVLGLTFLQEVM